MNVTMNQAEKVLSGNHTFSQLGLSMLLMRLKRLYDQSPTAMTLKKCTDEINVFLKKYERVMGSDYEIISKL